MFEKLVAWVLNTYIGEYVDDLNTDKLSVGVMNGQVELGNLPLKTDALRNLDMPIEVKSGFIGRVSLVIPWKNLNSAPWVITLEDLCLVAGPIIHANYDETREGKAEQDRKKAQLQTLEDKWKVEKQISSQQQQGSGAWGLWGYGASLVSMGYNIVENIQLEVKNVHIRYEDCTTIPGSQFACGVTIDMLSAQSTDASWLPKFVSRTNIDIMHKLADLKELAVYWDTHANMVAHLKGKELLDALQDAAKQSSGAEHSYILEPVTAEAKMKRNLSALNLKSTNTPRICLDIQMERMAFGVSDEQFQGMAAWTKEYNRFDKARRYRQWRPHQPVKGHAKEWWKFAIQSHLHFIQDKNSRLKKDYMLERARDSVLYVDAYTEKLKVGEYYMDRQQKLDLERIEDAWSFECLKMLRQLVMKRTGEDEMAMQPSEPEPGSSTPPSALSPSSPIHSPTSQTQQSGYLQSWFPGWGGWYAPTNPTGGAAAISTDRVDRDGSAESTGKPPTSPGYQTPPETPSPGGFELQPPHKVQKMDTEEDKSMDVEREIEHELGLDALQDSAENNTLLKRDAVFARVNFCLQSGTFKLLTESRTDDKIKHTSLLEVEASTITMSFESRPRTQGLKYSVSVGGWFLTDKMTQDSILPTLIAPQYKDRNALSRSAFGSMLSGNKGPILTPSALFRGQPSPENETLFELMFEKNPAHSAADYRLDIKTKPLDIVYNPFAIKRVKEFFTVRDPENWPKSEIELAVAAKNRYEQLKKQTQEELRQTLDNLLEGDEQIKAKRWDFSLDISAPQIIMPKDFSDPKSTLVVFDLGHLHFHNMAAGLETDRKQNTEEVDMEEDFVTPSSTPPNDEKETTEVPNQTNFSNLFSELSDLSEAALHDKIYDKYLMSLTELQVMVGQAQDKWKYARTKGTSAMHVVDKFSISLTFERRLLYTSDPQWPKSTLAGTLPSLNLHVSEHKLMALQSCMEQLSASSPTEEEFVPVNVTIDKPKEEQKPDANVTSVEDAAAMETDAAKEKAAAAEQADSRSMLAQFSINHASLDVQSRGRSIAELQVSAVRANFTKRLYNTSMSLTIHSLLVVDALQTFGKDFELLVASHKNLCLDSRSGSIHESDPNSPISPQSPVSPRSPAEPVSFPTSQQGLNAGLTYVQTAVTNALQGLVSGNTTETSARPSGSTLASLSASPSSSFNISEARSPHHPDYLPINPMYNEEALITIELDIVKPSCSSPNVDPASSDNLHILSVNFNNLDFVANQHTLVELLGFMNRISPTKKENPKSGEEKEKTKAATMEDSQELAKGSHWEFTADFNRLNVLLMRVEERDKKLAARKVATATMSEARFQGKMAGSVELSGSLSGLQLLDLTMDDVPRNLQTVLSVGLDSSINSNTHLSYTMAQFRPPPDLMYQTADDTLDADATTPDDTKALTFKMSRRSLERGMILGGGSEEVEITFSMASLLYTHSPIFLKDLSQCLTEIKDYMSGVGNTIKSAATEVAMGLVHHPTELLGQSLYGSMHGLDSPLPKGMTSQKVDGISSPIQGATSNKHVQLKLDAHFQTPVIFFPRSPRSSQVLVAHLGKIAISNSSQQFSRANLESTSYSFEEEAREKLFVEIREMSVYSTDLDRPKPQIKPAKEPLSTSVFCTPQPGGFVKTIYGTQILHNTAIELSVEKLQAVDMSNTSVTEDLQFRFSPFQSMNTSLDATSKPVMQSTVIQVTGKVVTPLKLTLSKHVYEQILKTLDNIAPPDDDEIEQAGYSSPRHSLLPDIIEMSESMEPSLSSLNLGVSPEQHAEQDKQRPDPIVQEAKDDSSDLILRANFEMPIFNILMTGDLDQGEQGLVDIKLQDFRVSAEKADQYTKTLEVELKSLVMEDLLQEPSSKHRRLMASFKPDDGISGGGGRAEASQFLSSSCPTSNIDLPDTAKPHSLPSSFNRENVFASNQVNKPTTRRTQSNKECPCTPPPSPLGGTSPERRDSITTTDDMLVRIKVKLVDKKCPQFATEKYNSTHRYIDVDFSSLDTIVNLQTWVMLLDYLGMGAKVHDVDQFTQEAQMTRSAMSPQAAGTLPQSPEEKEPVNSEVNLKIKSFSLVFNKKDYEFLKASMDSFNSHVSLRDGNFAIKGELGCLSLRDQSPHGSLYRERFITTGPQALDFDIVKYGTPDPDLLRNCDISVKLRMSSIRYVHTNHFIQETLAFLQHFNQLQDVLGRMRAANEGKKIAEKAFRGARICLDIEAGSPIMLIPHSSRTTDVLVLDMGTLSVCNRFLFSGDEGTILHGKNLEKKERDAARRRANSESSKTASNPTESSLYKTDMMMSQSIYGSLDGDLRSNEMASPQETTNASLINQSKRASIDQSMSDSNVLGSFYNTLGGSASCSQASSPIGGQASPTSKSSPKSEHPEEDGPQHICLVDVMSVELADMEVFSAEWKTSDTESRPGDLRLPSYLIQRQTGKMLKEKCKLTLQVERNLEGDISHDIPDFQVSGGLSSVHFSLDLSQFKLVKGLLAHNFGEPLPEFETPLMSHLQDPKIQTVLSGEVWKSVSISLVLDNVVTELLVIHQSPGCAEASLAKWNFIRSTLAFESYSNGSKDIDLVSHEIRAGDTRYKDAPVNTRPSVFSKILQPTTSSSSSSSHPASASPTSDPSTSTGGGLQMELHYRSTKEAVRFTVLLNSMRLMGVFDWLLAVKDFLLTPVDDPWKRESDGGSGASTPARGSEDKVSLPMAVSTGILTKRAPTVEPEQTPPFELKLNVTDTEIVLVEDTSAWDTNAVILKNTAMLSFRPSFKERPLSCTLLSLEVFSCSLAAEEETALSIIDPMTVTVELTSTQPRALNPHMAQRGLLDATSDKPPTLEVQFSALNIRLSYNDLKLFRAIMNAMPQQITMATKPKNLQQKGKLSEALSERDIGQLQGLGFSRSDCEQALRESCSNVNDAAMWLTANAKPISTREEAGAISGYEIKAGNICICVIDDCLDADVPLVEMTFSAVNFVHKLDVPISGRASFKLSVDYYNRSLSGWEPVLEQWGATMLWNKDQHGKMALEVKTPDLLKLNVTSTLVEQYRMTKSKWAEDLNKHTQERQQGLGIVCSRRRTPFIPFAIRNHTGCPLHFATVTTTPTRINLSEAASSSTSQDHHLLQQHSQHEFSEWRLVRPGDELPFLIEEREKIRHKHTHELKVHQLAVRVDGWKEVTPVSVDKVGVYFRQAEPQDTAETIEPSSSCPKQMSDLPTARVVFDVGIEGSARKVITIRSALMVENQLNEKVEVKLENTLPYAHARNHSIEVAPSCSMPVPLPYVHSRIWVRPKNWSLDYCHKPIMWQHVNRTGRQGESSHLRVCDTIGGEVDTYRFCVSVVRQPYPPDPAPRLSPTTHHKPHVYAQPGHYISLLPPVRVVNLLPIDLNYYLKDTDVHGTVKPGEMAPLVTADLRQALELGITLENFPTCKELVIPPGTQDYKVKLRLYDTQERKLELWVRIKAGLGGSLKLFLSAPYWLVNKSGLPLIFRQDGASTPGAGQFEEHELARSVVPLLFSYSDKELANMASMKVGKSVHGPDTMPKWCARFSLESGIGFRPLHVASKSNRPDWVYNIGIEVRPGRGRYCDTNIVTFSPRYQLDNRSCHKLAFAQKHMADKGQNPNSGDILYALPNCKLSYHWPRVDLDQLLCARPMDTPCDWSGGFRIDLVDSFHISMRGDCECLFLRIDIVLQGATFFIVFTDADQMPPPYRIDNFSKVAIQYFQTKVTNEKLRTQIKPQSKVAYAWDEPTLPPHLTLSVPGGSSATYNMDVVGDGDKLYYENFIYLAMTATFKKPSPTHTGSATYNSFVESQSLVLEVDYMYNNKVILKKKETGNRNQLWRMTGAGMLQHEGSSVPRDPKRNGATSPGHSSGASTSSSSTVCYVLDIDDIAIQPGRDVALVIRKQDPRRKNTQTWKFLDDGRLCCGSSSSTMCVQAKEGIFGLREGGEAILGSAPSALTSKKSVSLPAVMCVEPQRMRPGSGMLSVKVVTDGPTRVLQVMDIRQQRYKSGGVPSLSEWVMVEEESKRPDLQSDQDGTNTDTDITAITATELDVHVKLSAGIGISLVTKKPEELLFITLSDIDMDYTTNTQGQTVEVSVKNMQVDNQLLGCSRPVLLYLTPSRSEESSTNNNQPALHLSAHKMPSHQWNADIFRHLSVQVRRLTLQIEEIMLWRLVQFLQMEKLVENVEESGFDTQRALTAATSSHFKRYYFGTLKLNCGRVLLSMLTASELPLDLQEIKKSMGIPLIKFEDAKVELDPFSRLHLFETSAFLQQNISMHYTEELKSQAAKILGSVDFLGNPLGLFNDVTEGLSGLLKDGNVGGLVKNVAHGVSDSAAKVTGSVSDGLSIISFDESYQRRRQAIRDAGNGAGHFVQGVKGLGYGLLGGLTSIVSQTYSGVREDGIEGLFTGISKGVVGTVTKPVTGVLDFASGSASAIRDTSRGRARKLPPKCRRRRCCYGPGGLLPPYSEHHAMAQELLYSLNDNCFTEMFIAHEQLRFRDDTLRALISSDQVFLLGGEENSHKIIMNVAYDQLFHCRALPYDKKHFIELTMKSDTERGVTSDVKKKRPLVRCDSEAIARKVAQQINYAKNLYDERRQTLPELNIGETHHF